MASISKRGNSYRIKVSCGYDAHGRQVSQYKTWKPEPGMTKKQIEKELQRQAFIFEEECMGGNTVCTIKFEDFAKQWFKEYAYIRLKAGTIAGYENMTPRIYKSLGHIRMDKLTPHHIQKFIVDLTECERFDTPKKHGGKLSTKTIKLYKSFVSTVCDYAVKMQIIKENPCKNVTIPKVVTPEKDFYSVEEAQRLLELFEQEPDENYMFVCFYTVAIYTGFRLGELLGLEWKDIDFDANVLSVKRTSLYTKEKGIYTDTPKTASSIRSLKVPQGVMDCLVKWKGLQDVQREKLGTQWIDTDRIFTKWNGDYLCRAAPSHFFHKFCDRTGMRYVSNHSMRHLNASLLVNAGVDIKTVQSCLGHSTPTTTLQIYLHTFQSAQARAMDAVAEVLPIGTKFPKNNIKFA